MIHLQQQEMFYYHHGNYIIYTVGSRTLLWGNTVKDLIKPVLSRNLQGYSYLMQVHAIKFSFTTYMYS